MGAQCSCQVPEEVDANEEFPLTPSKEYYSSKHGDCFQVGEDASDTVRSAGSTSIPSDECSCSNDSKELGFKETDSQEEFLLRGQSSRSCRSYHLAGLPGDDGLSQASKGSLARLQMLVEGADFLGAEVELAKLMDELADPASADERAIISASPLVMHIKDELRLYREVGQQCCQFTEPDSFLLYSNEHLHQSIHGSFDRHNPRVFHYHLRMVFPFQLANVFSVAFEEELSTEWNSMLLKTPELIENEQGLHTVTSSQASAMLGLLKLDFLDRTQRFIDVEGGMLVEYNKTVEEGPKWFFQSVTSAVPPWSSTMTRVGTSPGFELNGINHNLLRAGSKSNLTAATAAIADPYLRLRPARWHDPTWVRCEREPRKVSEQLQSYQIDQISESLHQDRQYPRPKQVREQHGNRQGQKCGTMALQMHQELHTFLEVFAIRLELREAALSDAAAEIRKSSEFDMQKRFDAFLEQAGAAAQRLLQELPVDFPARFQQVESQVLQMSSKDFSGQRSNQSDNSPMKEEKNLESSVEQMRSAIQLQGLSKGLKSLEERFSTMQSRLSRNEKTSQQALGQATATHAEALLDQISFQNLRRQVKEMSKTLAAASLSVSAEDFEELQRKVFNLEHRLGEDQLVSPGDGCNAPADVASADSKDEPAERSELERTTLVTRARMARMARMARWRWKAFILQMELWSLSRTDTGVNGGYDCHRPPIKGFKRAENDVKSIWAACGPEKTLLLQAGTVQLPIPVTKWLATSIGGLVGRHLISNMVKTAQRSTQPGNPWDKAMAEDSFGIYSKLYQCAQSPASLARSRDPECHLSNSDFQRFFNRTLPH
eukprot:s2443_g4.t2